MMLIWNGTLAHHGIVPTRVCFASSGSEFGWRSGTRQVARLLSGQPSQHRLISDRVAPTGVAFGTGAKFPEKYQRALFICDWSYGLIYAVHLKQDGGGYTGEAERFCSAPALQGTDISMGPDGANVLHNWWPSNPVPVCIE